MTMPTMTTNQIAIAPGTTGSPDLLGYFVFAEQIVANFRLPYATTSAKPRRQLMHELALLSLDPNSSMDRESDVDIWGFDRE